MSPLVMIHIVDDDEPVRSSLMFALNVLGYPCISYADGAEYLAARDPAQPSVLVSDVRMPGMSGIELARRLRSDSSTMPIILITGHADGEIRTDALRAGADLLLDKPVDLAVLVAEIERMTAAWG